MDTDVNLVTMQKLDDLEDYIYERRVQSIGL